jgi:hypothetical protein
LLLATYIIDQTGNITWSFIDNDHGVRVDPEDFVAAIPGPCKSEMTEGSKTPEGNESLKDEEKMKRRTVKVYQHGQRKGTCQQPSRKASRKFFGKSDKVPQSSWDITYNRESTGHSPMI